MDQSFSKEHLNWIKASFALRHVKQGLVDISNETAKQLHEDILKKLTIQSSIAAITKCSDCNPNDVTKVNVKYGSGWKWTINCSSNVCNAWLEEILRYHKHSLRASVAWANCDPSLWSSDPWEVAKVFQGPGSGGQKGAEDSDCAGLLTLLQDCTFFSKLVQGRSLVQEVKIIRNKVMHSGNLEVESCDLELWLDRMVDLLKDAKLFSRLEACQKAAAEIRKVRIGFI